MEDLQWGLMMMVVSMGVVFALLFLLTGVLMLIGLVLFKGKEMRQEIEKNLHV